MQSCLSISIIGNELRLHPSGALYWKEMDALLIADPHIGKIDDFRRAGMAVPRAARKRNYENLDALIRLFQPERVIFLGDLFHNRKNTDWDAFTEWSSEQSAEQTLILGNHDRFYNRMPGKERLNTRKEWVVGQFRLTHQPVDSSDQFNICGHVHPGVLLRGKGGLAVKTPCFAVYDNRLILPSFGTFTGMHKIDPKACEHVYVSSGDEVIQVK